MKLIRIVLCGLGLSACAESPERFPPASESCGGRRCEDPVLSGAGKGTAPPGVPAKPPEKDAGPALTSGAISGEVVLVSSADLTRASRALTEPVSVFVPGSLVEIETVVEPGGEFQIEIDQPPPWWVRVVPSEQSPELLSVLQAVPAPGRLQLFALERAALSDVSQSLTRNPVALDPDRGQVILHLVDEDGLPLSGVRLEPSSGILAYDIGETYTDATDTTATRGAVAIFNVAAAAAPGREASVQASVADLSLELSFPVVKDTLTSAVFVLRSP